MYVNNYDSSLHDKAVVYLRLVDVTVPCSYSICYIFIQYSVLSKFKYGGVFLIKKLH